MPHNMMHDDHARYQYVTTIRHSFTERIGTFLVETAGKTGTGKTGTDLFSLQRGHHRCQRKKKPRRMSNMTVVEYSSHARKLARISGAVERMPGRSGQKKNRRWPKQGAGKPVPQSLKSALVNNRSPRTEPIRHASAKRGEAVYGSRVRRSALAG